MSFRIGGIRLKIHILLPLMWLFTFLTGAGAQMIPTMLALLLHESGHLIAARLLHIPIAQIEITPYGGLIMMEDIASQPPIAAFFVAFSGPLASLIGFCISCFGIYQGILSISFAHSFARANLLLLLINLSPALPLDGGRMLRTIMSRYVSWQKATRVLSRAGYIIGILFISISILFAFHGTLIFTPIFIGFYFIYAAAQEQKSSLARYITALIARRKLLDERTVMPVQYLAVSENARLYALLTCMHPGKYHMLIVLSEDGLKYKAILHEQQLCQYLMENDPAQKIADCIEKNSNGS